MSKIISIKASQDQKRIKAQEIDFDSNGEIIEIKGIVGSGKSTVHKIPELAMSGGSKKQFKDPAAEGDFDNEVCISAAQKIYMRTSSKDGNWNGICFQKTDDGKISKDPIINGKKMTPAVARDTFQTELTFGAGRFISSDPKVHFDFMMHTYSHKLKAMGVVFDKKAPDYHGSILWRLEQAKMDRTAKEYRKKALNGFKNHLEAEGYDEQNVTAVIEIESLESQKRALEQQKIEAERKHNQDASDAKISEINRIQIEIDKLTGRAVELMGKITAYNSGLEAQEQLRAEKFIREIEAHNKRISDDRINHNDASECVLRLAKFGYENPGLVLWVSKMGDSIQKERNSTLELAALPSLAKVPLTEGKVSDYTPKYTEDINACLIELIELRKQIAPLFTQKQNPAPDPDPFDPSSFNTDSLASQIEAAKVTNKVAERWDSFFDHQVADENVKAIWKEYCEMFTKIDLGVPGLQMSIIGDEDKSEIRTVYDGQYNPSLFGNETQENRLLSAYSETQKPIIAILMQKYLLDEKIKKGEDGLRAIFVEMPMDKATRLTLKRMKNEFDIDIFTSTTGDFDRDSLKDGQFIIENGYLLAK